MHKEYSTTASHKNEAEEGSFAVKKTLLATKP
jgi:hypothetical protein